MRASSKLFVGYFEDFMRPLTWETSQVACNAKTDNLRAPSSSQSQWFRVVLKQRSGDNVPTVHTMGSTPIFQPSPPGHIKPWISPLPKASGGFSHASRASMGIVFLPPQWPNQLWEHFLLLSRPFYSRPAQTLPGLNRVGQERKGTCLHVRFTHIQREKSNCSDMHACAHAHMSACLHTPHTSFNAKSVWKEGKHWIVGHRKENTSSWTTVLQMTNRGETQCNCIFSWWFSSN